jgi:hypothetical protein
MRSIDLPHHAAMNFDLGLTNGSALPLFRCPSGSLFWHPIPFTLIC